jgi:two-component system, cell cycle response regulator
LASYRTGLKLAIWHSLILLVLHEAAATGVLPALLRTGAEHPAPLVAAVWLAAIATSTASSVNERELRRRRFESEALAGMAASLEAASQPDTVAAILVAAAAETLDLPRAVVLDTRDGARVLAAHGAVGAPAGAAVSPLLARVTARREPVLLAGIPQADEAWLAALLPEARNVVLLPMAAQGRAFAVLVAEHGARVGSGLERRTLATAERIADHGALSLSNAWLHRRLAEHAHTDGLTGVANRRAFDTAFDAARAGDDDVALLLLDLDHFKRVNDVHGHEVGDEVLRQLGHLLMAQVPAAALPARFGGEEFAVLWPGADPEEARATAEALRAAIAAAPMPVPVTASVGVAHLRAGRGDTSTLLRAADEALYAAKHAGRDRVVGPAVTAPAPVTANASTRPIPMPVLDPAQGTAP